MAFFDARLQGTPVRGAVLVQLNDGGGGAVPVLFDRPADIARSFPAMSRQRSAAREQSAAYDRANKGFSSTSAASRCSRTARPVGAATSTATMPTRW
jgi:hypothetical protein